MRIFGFGNRQEDLSAGGAAHGLTDARLALDKGNPAQAARIDLVEQIGLFLIANRLDINPRNLTIAHTIFSGANLRLAHKLAERQFSGQPVTQPWLEEIMAHAAEIREREELEEMLLIVGETMGKFIDTAREASDATSSYTCAMKEHAVRIEAMEDGQAVDISALTRLTRAMIERSWQMEEEMRRSEQEAAGLRKKLERARHEAGVDYLTGLPNRRAFEAVFDIEYRKARAAIEHLTIAFCDIDNFKAVNDTHGHDTGDRVIQCVADLFLQISNQNCHVARHGGEEFVLLFRGLGAAETHARLDELRESFARRRLIDRDTNLPIGFITFSGGVADVFAYEEPRLALKAADEALYSAKKLGRNRIVIANS
jgi:diguanylate cyclase